MRAYVLILEHFLCFMSFSPWFIMYVVANVCVHVETGLLPLSLTFEATRQIWFDFGSKNKVHIQTFPALTIFIWK
jgi:hypothetical protein